MTTRRRYVDPRAPGHQRWTLKAINGIWRVWNAPPVMEEDEGRELELQPGVEPGPRCESVCHTGPGHQSTFRCQINGEHPNDPHMTIEGGWLLEWDEDGEMVD